MQKQYINKSCFGSGIRPARRSTFTVKSFMYRGLFEEKLNFDSSVNYDDRRKVQPAKSMDTLGCDDDVCRQLIVVVIRQTIFQLSVSTRRGSSIPTCCGFTLKRSTRTLNTAARLQRCALFFLLLLLVDRVFRS